MLTLEKVLSRCIKEGECFIWTRAFNSDGYPRAGVTGNPNIKLHRFVCAHFHEIEGLVVRHTCDNIKCLNPEHLIPGTVADNVKDMDERGRRYRVINEEKAQEIISLIEKGYINKVIARWTEVDPRRVSEFRTGKRDKHGKLVKL